MAEQRVHRRLAAILAADVVGYGRLMGGDEVGTRARFNDHLHALIEPVIATRQGRIVKTTGDGLLVEFASVVEAVQCALAIQEGMAERNGDEPPDRRIVFRIGVNLGDVIVEGDDIHGDGVNVAARLETLADPGGVCISGKVFEEVKNKLAAGFDDLGNQKVKNIAEPVRAYRIRLDGQRSTTAAAKRPNSRRRVQAIAGAAFVLIVAGGVAAWWRPWLSAPGPDTTDKPELSLPDQPSIAVLPFANVGNDSAQEYFSDGMTEDLITGLSRVSGLFVIARNSVFAYKGRAAKATEISRDLGVRYVLEGSVRRVDTRIRITAELIDATTGFNVWAERFDRELKDVFALQDEVVAKIIAALEVRLTNDERRNLARKTTASIEAYDLFLKAFALFWHFNKEANLAARALLEQAIALDPRFARAYGVLARTYVAEIDSGWSEDPAQSLQMANLLARKAVGLDGTLPEVHFVMGLVHMNEREHSAAVAEARNAIARNPNYADGYALLAWVLQFAGQAEESLPVIAKAMRLNPHYPFAYLFPKAEAYFALGRYAQSARALEEALMRNPGAQRVHIWLAAAYALAGRKEDAKWEAQEILTLDPDFSVGPFVRTVPYKDSAQLERIRDGLLAAGLPP